MQFDDCIYENAAAAIRDILNEATLNATALYDYQPRMLEAVSAWFKAKEADAFPVIGAFASVTISQLLRSYDDADLCPAASI